jgi:hypothetical protein
LKNKNFEQGFCSALFMQREKQKPRENVPVARSGHRADCSITSSAAACRICGIASPSVLAVPLPSQQQPL